MRNNDTGWHRHKRKMLDEFEDAFDDMTPDEQFELASLLREVVSKIATPEDMESIDARTSFATAFVNAHPEVEIIAPQGQGHVWFAYTWDKFPGVRFLVCETKKHPDDYSLASDMLEEIGTDSLYYAIEDAWDNPWDEDVVQSLAIDSVQWHRKDEESFEFQVAAHCVCGGQAEKILDSVLKKEKED